MLVQVCQSIFSMFRETVIRTIINSIYFPAPRIQFFAIEIARNREGHNKVVYTSVQDKEEEKGANRGEKEKTNKGGEKEANKGINKHD